MEGVGAENLSSMVYLFLKQTSQAAARYGRNRILRQTRSRRFIHARMN